MNKLKAKTVYLYRRSIWRIVQSHWRFVCGNTARYFKGISLAFTDAVKVGLFTRTGFGLLYRFFMAAECADILKRKACCHLHVHFAHIPTDIAMYAAWLAGIPFSFTAHANDIFQRGWLLKEKIDRSSFAITISDYNRQHLISHSADSDKIHTIHCGVETDTFAFDPQKENGYPPVIGTLCRLVDKKGIDVLIRACKLLLDDGLPAKLMIAGDGPLKKDLETLAMAMNISGQVFFIGNLSNDKVAAWLKTIDLFVLPCRKDFHGDQDGIPVVLMEAMASGVNVISTCISGIPELIEDGISGLLVRPDDPNSIANAIRRIVEDKTLGQRLRTNAASVLGKRFNLNTNAEMLSTLIKESIR